MTQFRFDPRNARRHPTESKRYIRKSLEDVGAFRSIGVDGDGIVRAGNGVYEQALALGMEVVTVEAQPNQLVAVVRPDLHGEDAIRAALYDNQAPSLSKWDSTVLAEVLASMPKTHAAVFSVDDAAAFLTATAQNAEDEPQGTEGGSTAGNALEAAQDPQGASHDPAFGMVMGQIKHFPKWNKKRSLRFLSFRIWRESTKAIDLGILKEAKKACRPAQVELVAKEIADGLRDTFKVLTHACITNPPRGSSTGENHFATMIARKVADILDIEYCEAFESRVETGRPGRTSHPRNFRERGELVIKETPPLPFVILVDDVATSATTLETCTNVLAGAGFMVLPVAWIYENEADLSL